MGNSFIANRVFPLTAKYLNDVDTNDDSSNQFRHISFFKCNTAYRNQIVIVFGFLLRIYFMFKKNKH